jgi:V/A-type H+-transporting ATPase subunit E
MAETIETFVARLQADGVRAGRAEAEEIVAKARRQAEEIVSQAERTASEIVSDARRQAEQNLERSRGELDLAARDAVLKLRQAIEDVVESILARGAADQLGDSDFLAELLHDLVMLYARSDIDRSQNIEINVSPEAQAKLAEWAISRIVRKAEEAGTSVDLKGALSSAGFEYTVSGATIEVTPESVVEVLSELVGPRLKEIIDSAMSDTLQGRQSS